MKEIGLENLPNIYINEVEVLPPTKRTKRFKVEMIVKDERTRGKYSWYGSDDLGKYLQVMVICSANQSLNQRFDSGNGDYFRLLFYKNGSAGTSYPHGMAIYRDNDGFNYISLTITSLIQLNANDYVEAWAYSSTDTSWTLQRESQFYGYLVG